MNGIRGSVIREGNRVTAEIPSLRLAGQGNTIDESLASLRSSLESLSSSPIQFYVEETFFVVVPGDSDLFDEFCLKQLEKITR